MALAKAPFVGPPRSYTAGRVRQIQYVGIHCTEGSEGPQSAEDGVAYDKRRLDGTSTHEFTDSNNALCEVRAIDRSHALRFHGNEIGYSIETCGRAGQTDAQWDDAASRATLDITAQRVAALFIEWGWPITRVRRLSVAETRAAYFAPVGQRPFGIVGHVDVSMAYPEDQGDHTDPGRNFPWTSFLAAVRTYMLAETGQPTESETAMRFLFQGFSDQGAPNDSSRLVHLTGDQVTYRLQPAPGEFTAIGTRAGNGPVTIVKPADLPEEYRTYAKAVAAVCGRQDVAPVAGGDHTHAVSVPVSVTVSGSGSGSGSGETGPAVPTP